MTTNRNNNTEKRVLIAILAIWALIVIALAIYVTTI